MVVTWAYNAGTNTATASGAGSTNFAALVAADTAGGWGKFTADAAGYQILCQALIIIGDGTNICDFSDMKKSVTFISNITTSGGTALITVAAKSSFTMGTLLDATTYSTSDGMSFFVEPQANWHKLLTGTATSDVYLYSCSFTTASAVDTVIDTRNLTNRVWNCLLSKVGLGFSKSSGDFFNLMILNAPYPWYAVGTIERVFITHNVYGCLRFIGDTYTVRNLYCRDIQSHFIECGYMPLSTTPVYMINVDSDLWDINWIGSPYGIIYRQYTFNLEVFDAAGVAINGATVLLEQSDGTDAFSVATDATGAIAEQTVSRGYYAQATGDTLQDYGPFTLTISKAGYIPYVHTGIVLDEKVDWRVSLHPQLSGDAIAGDVMLGKTFYSNDADTKLTGTYTPTQLMEQRTKIRRVENPVDELLLMYTGMLTIENQKLRRNRIEPKPS